MDEANGRILLGILWRESIAETAKAVNLSVSVIHDRLRFLRDNGYIKPWPPRLARVRVLTETGRQVVRSLYGAQAFER